MNTYYRNPSTKGFTLIEMLLTVAIIGILASITNVSLNGAREKGRDTERVTEVSQIALAVELYYNACRQYPATLALTANNGCPSGITLNSFLGDLPSDPQGAAYTYAVNGTDEFVVKATLETNHTSLNNDLDVTTLTDCTDTNRAYCKGS